MNSLLTMRFALRTPEHFGPADRTVIGTLLKY